MAEVADSGAVDLDELVSRPGRWYLVHTYSGHEARVKSYIEQRRSTMHLEEKIYEVVIPESEEVEVKNNKRVTVKKKIFPGYILVRCEADDEAIAAIRSTPGVTGFVGPGGRPIPLSPEEVKGMLALQGEAARAKPRVPYEVGDAVRVKEGPFADFSGQIAEVNEDQAKVVVRVNIFGRETPVELEFSQIERL